MRRLAFAFAGAAAGLATLMSGSAFAYQIDPLTRQPIVETFTETRPEATAIPRSTVSYDGKYRPGTIVVSTTERRMYYVLGDGKAIRYGVGVGRPGFEWSGTKTITAKREWPDWRPPSEMLKRRPDLPRYMPGGPEILSAHAPCISAPRSIASTAPTSRIRSARLSRRDASACSTTTWWTFIPAPRSAPRSSSSADRRSHTA